MHSLNSLVLMQLSSGGVGIRELESLDDVEERKIGVAEFLPNKVGSVRGRRD